MEQTAKIIQMEKILDSRVRCSICNKPKKAMVLDLPWGKTTVYPDCKCESEAYEKTKREQELKERQRRLERLFKQSRLGKRFKDCTFENFILREGTKEAFEAAKDYANNFDNYRKEGHGLLFTSIPGTGKTHLCGAIVNELISRFISAIFIVVPELLLQLDDARRKGTQGMVLDGLSDCDLLILDDLGAEDNRDWNMDKIFTIMDSRYRNNKPIIITTNLDSNELREHVGIRTFSRILEICRPIKLTCDDYRLRNY